MLPVRPPGPKQSLWRNKEFILLMIFSVLLIISAGLMVYFYNQVQANKEITQSELNKMKTEENTAKVEETPVEWEGMLNNVEDFADFIEADTIYMNDTGYQKYKGYWYLLKRMAIINPQYIADRAKTIIYDKYSENPVKYRGRFVKLKGYAIHYTSIKLEPNNPLGRDFIHRVLITDNYMSNNDVYRCDLLDMPEKLKTIKSNGLTEADIVSVEGVFYRTAEYESERGLKQRAPYILAKNLTVVNMATEERNVGNFSYIGVGIFALLIAVYITIRQIAKGRPKPPANMDSSIGRIKTIKRF